MTPEEQMNFACELIENVKKDIVHKILVPGLPAEWDGHELREYIAEKFGDCRSRLMTEPRSPRRRKYKNTVLVSDL